MKRDAPAIHGVLVVQKPVGPTSHDVVAVARRSLGLSRIGHTGTLDPQASGVLPLVVGQATRLAQYLSGSDKEYEATIRFGVVTDTYDASGRVIEDSQRVPSADAVEEALMAFRGTYDQMPPAFSAKMVDGERAYVRARAGQAVRTTVATVTAHAVQLLALEGPAATVRVRCSAGFYVRSLAHDLGQALGTGAILVGLVRTEAAGFRLGEAVPFEEVVTAPRETLWARVLPMERLLLDWPSVQVTAEGLAWAVHGRDLGPPQVAGGRWPADRQVRLLDEAGRLVGLGGPAKTAGFLHPDVIFSYN